MVSWQAISIVVVVLLAIGGGLGSLIQMLAKKYFETLERRIEALEYNSKDFQGKMLTAIQSIEKTLVKLEAGEQRFITEPVCNLNNKQIEEKFVRQIGLSQEDIYKEIVAVETRIEKKVDELQKKIERHLEKEKV